MTFHRVFSAFICHVPERHSECVCWPVTLNTNTENGTRETIFMLVLPLQNVLVCNSLAARRREVEGAAGNTFTMYCLVFMRIDVDHFINLILFYRIPFLFERRIWISAIPLGNKKSKTERNTKIILVVRYWR